MLGGVASRHCTRTLAPTRLVRSKVSVAKPPQTTQPNEEDLTPSRPPSVAARLNYDIAEKDFCLRKVLLVRKVTRYEYEKFHLKPDLGEEKLRQHVLSKGSDYDELRKRHDEYYRSLDVIQNHFTKRGIEYNLIHRYEYGKSYVDWADAIFTAGGDGTFLMAASKVGGRSTPVIGINTDPLRSEGFLCLPKEYANNLGGALDRILNNDFRWYWRQRIRLSMSGQGAEVTPVDLQNEQLLFPEHRFWEHVKENEQHVRRGGYHEEGEEEEEDQILRPLPVLALNEVFIGESLSARVSFYELSIDGAKRMKQKSSGLMICPGTGSTSWYFNVSNITTMTTKEILRIAQKYHGCTNAKLQDDNILQKIASDFNSALIFSPSESKMAYCIRDPLRTGIFQAAQPRGFCRKIWLKSRMYDACVVIDGSLSYRFNHGAVVELELNDQDALRCIRLE